MNISLYPFGPENLVRYICFYGARFSGSGGGENERADAGRVGEVEPASRESRFSGAKRGQGNNILCCFPVRSAHHEQDFAKPCQVDAYSAEDDVTTHT